MAEFVTLQENPKIKEYQEKLHGLRSDGVNKITEIKQAIAKVKKNPMIEYDKKPQILADYKKQLEEANKHIVALEREVKTAGGINAAIERLNNTTQNIEKFASVITLASKNLSEK